MSDMDHWHPVLDARRLRHKPVGVRLNGREVVLFRGGAGQLGALDDCCPHRRMRLSLGQVVEGRLQCRYHGWSYNCHGAGESPGTPKLHAQAGSYDVVERHGWIWLKAAGAVAAFPEFDVAGFSPVGTLAHEIEAPLELVLDNFTEIEHTPTTHALLGYELRRMSEVETRVEATETTVRVYNAGPQKRISPFIELLFGIRTGDGFVDDWTTCFSPVYAEYNQYWFDAQTRVEKGVRWRIYVFFTPLDPQRTALATFAFVKPPSGGGWRNWLLFRPTLMWLVDREIRLDKIQLENLADKNPHVEGMKLSRFDKVLGLQRERIEAIYRGHEAGEVVPDPSCAV